MQDPKALVESVSRFRIRAHAIFYQWTFAWLRLTGEKDASLDRAKIVAALVQVLYWSVLKRNPTVQEWVTDVIRFNQLRPLSPRFIRQELEYRKKSGTAHADSSLNINKPWWNLFHLAHRDEDGALRAFALQVGRAFMSRRLSSDHLVELLPEGTDWTQVENIDALVEKMLHPPKTSWWKQLLTFLGG